MEFIKTNIEGLLVIQPRVFGDERGHFFESFRQDKFNEAVGEEINFLQDNQSLSSKNIVRGIHFQKAPFAQGKLVRVIKGAVIDVAVDLRKNSPTYGEHFSIELTEDNKKMFWIPAGFGHGFSSLEDETIFCYKCTNYYDKNSEGCIVWNDETLNIDWEVNNPIVSEKDKLGENFTNFISPF